jgi:hypothetical protein
MIPQSKKYENAGSPFETGSNGNVAELSSQA